MGKRSLYLGKMVLFGQTGSIWAKGGCICAKAGCIGVSWFYLGKRWLYLDKRCLYLYKMVLFRQKFVVFGRKVVVFWQNGSIWASWFNLGKLAQFGQICCVWTKLIDFSGMMDPLKLTCSQQLWLHSSVGRALHRYRRGHGFESR